MYTISEVLIEFLKFVNINTIFGVPGSNMDFLKYVYDDKSIKFISNKDEKNSVYMAMGYTKASNKISCCFGSVGAGAFNLVPGVISAYYESTPVLVIGGQVPLIHKGKNAFQESTGIANTISQLKLFKNITLYSETIDPKKMYKQLEQVYFHLHDFKSGPVYLELPSDIMNQKITFDINKFNRIKLNFNNYKLKMLKQYKKELLKVNLLISDLNKSKLPIIIIGEGSKYSSKLIENLAWRLKIPIFSTFKGKDKISNDFKFYMGCIGLIGTDTINNYVKESDMIISIGASLSQFSSNNWKLISDSKIYRLDTITNNISKNRGIIIRYDSNKIINLLLKKIIMPKNKKQDLINLKNSIINELNQNNSDQGLKINLINTLQKVIPNNAIIVSEDILLVGKFLKFYNQNTNINFTNLAPIGCALPGAIGAKIACPKNIVIAILGDGGFNMAISELNTIQNNNLKLIIILLNNCAYGTVYKYQKYKFNKHFYTTYQNPNYLKMGRLYNMDTYNINSITQIKNILVKAFKYNIHSTIININIDKNEKIGCKIY